MGKKAIGSMMEHTHYGQFVDTYLSHLHKFVGHPIRSCPHSVPTTLPGKLSTRTWHASMGICAPSARSAFVRSGTVLMLDEKTWLVVGFPFIPGDQR